MTEFNKVTPRWRRAVVEWMESEKITRSVLADRLGVSRGTITQLFKSSWQSTLVERINLMVRDSNPSALVLAYFEDEWTPHKPVGPILEPTDRARLLALFDAAAECRCDLVLYERDEPAAPETLALWASSRNLATESRGDEWPVFSVETSRFRRIDIHLRVALKACTA